MDQNILGRRIQVNFIALVAIFITKGLFIAIFIKKGYFLGGQSFVYNF